MSEYAPHDAEQDGVSFVQTWTMPDADHVDGWLQTMHDHIHVLTSLPGFRSMALYRGLDDHHTAVHARWDSLDDVQAGRDLQPAKLAHAELLRWGIETGTTYTLDRTYWPASEHR
jgi:heme-degrading monooxygenase HmoA